MDIIYNNIKDKIFGNCIKIENGYLEIIVTLDFGPRIISFNLKNYSNIFFQDPFKKPLGEYFDIYDGDIFKFYGGHRLWISPEILPRCYYPDNNKIKFNKIENGIEFIAPIEKRVDIQKSFSIKFIEKDRLEVCHYIYNRSLWDIEFSLWAITMMEPFGKAIIKMPNNSTGYLPNRNIAFWDYTNTGDKRLKRFRDFYLFDHKLDKNNFKMGLGFVNWAAYVKDRQIFIKEFDYCFDSNYPDFGCNFEIYANDEFLELETLSPIKRVIPNENACHKEIWRIDSFDFDINSEIDIKNIIEKYKDNL